MVPRDGTALSCKPGRVEVLAGLSPGERVIVEGTQKVREGVPVREVRGGQGSENP